MFLFFIHYIFCFALLNAYNDFIYFSIIIFLEMLKNNSLLTIVYWVLFILLLWVLFLSRVTSKNEQWFSFSYPDGSISFAGKVIPIDNALNYHNKQRFDKEFLLTSNNLYQFYLYVKRYPLYIPYIEEELKKRWLPDDLKYLAIAESALRNDVVSSAGAAGIWQFMPETGKSYGLQIDTFIDERYHFEKSTDAALKYLSKLYNDFWTWPLAMAAYNRWENWLRRDMESQWVDNYFDLYLNEETSRYVFRIVAIKYVLQSYFENKVVIDKIIWWTYKSPLTENIRIWKIEDLSLWSKEKWYNFKDIKNLNKWIIGNSLSEWDWNIKILTK